MSKFLCVYRGAAVYVIEQFDPSEGEKMGAKIVAKAVTPNLENMKVDFVDEASNKKEAFEKVKKDIDQFLDQHDMDKFVTDFF